MSAPRWMYAACLAAASARCGMVTSVQVQRRDPRINVVTSRSAGSLRATATQEGTVARLRVARVRLCQSHNVLEGYEEVTTTRAPEQPATVSLVTTAGVLTALTGLGVMLYPAVAKPPADGSSTISWDTSLPVGGGILGLGGLLLIPWIYTGLASGSSTATRAFREAQPPRSPPQPCGETPERALIALGSGPGARSEHTAGDDGRVDVDLVSALPPEAFRGASPWRTLALSSREGQGIGLIELTPFRQAVADAQWSAAERSRSEQEFERFAREFPGDPRAERARSSAARARRAREALARDAERARAWRDAGDDPERLGALIAEQVGDLWEAEAVCRVAGRAADVSALRDARGRCHEHLAALDPEARGRHPEVLRDAERSRDAIDRRIADAERAEADAQARAAEAQARAARRAAAAQRSAASQVRAILADCRAGRATGASPARSAYQSIALLRSHEGARVDRLVIQVAAACRCTPSCAGVAAP